MHDVLQVIVILVRQEIKQTSNKLVIFQQRQTRRHTGVNGSLARFLAELATGKEPC